MAQSPNYTLASADFIMDIVREYCAFISVIKGCNETINFYIARKHYEGAIIC